MKVHKKVSVKINKYLFSFSAMLIMVSVSHFSNAQIFNYQVNAIYVYSFTKYIEWPSTTGDIPSDQFVIGVLGDSYILNELKILTENKRVHNRSIVVRIIDLSEVKLCHLVVVSKSQSTLIKKVKEASIGLPVLIVTEKPGLTSKGAEICIFIDDEDHFKTKFELSKTNVIKKGLKIASELINLAEIVY
ncbi:MAG: YfiR family protein [Bacteroidota bacterium]